MNSKKFLCLLAALLLLCLSTPIDASAEPRNIYIGDIITLEITSLDISEDELKQKFQDFELVEIKNKPDGYLISLRTLDVGEKTILLGDKEIIINVNSTLEDIQREDIFEGEIKIIESGFSFYWRILFYMAAGVFVLLGIYILSKTLLKKKVKPESPYQIFLRRSASLKAGDDNYFVDLTFYFKEYIENLYKQRIIGKTSTEILKELHGLQALDDMLSDIHMWLTDCDMFKFTGVEVSEDEKRRHYMKLLSLAEKIEMKQCDISGGTA